MSYLLIKYKEKIIIRSAYVRVVKETDLSSVGRLAAQVRTLLCTICSTLIFLERYFGIVSLSISPE